MRPDLILDAYRGLYPEKPFRFEPVLTYSAKFRGFNANIKLAGSRLTVSMSRQWKGVSKDIQLGLVQDLLVRLFRDKRDTANMRLYLSFMRNVHYAVPKTKTDARLAAAFQRLNDRFFDGMLDLPNFEWMDSRNPVGYYEYGTDTIRLSRHLRDPEVLEYVLYHEMLHKKHKFPSVPGRRCHHTREFREDEAKFPNAAELERRLSRPRSLFSLFGF